MFRFISARLNPDLVMVYFVSLINFDSVRLNVGFVTIYFVLLMILF